METEDKQGRDREREGDRVWSRLQALSHQHRARCGAPTHEPRDYDLSSSWMLNQPTEPPRCPKTAFSHLHVTASHFHVFLRTFSFSIFLKIYLFWERERKTESEWGRGRERGRHRIRSRLQALSCQHRAWCGAWTHELRDHDLSWSQTLNQLSHPGVPYKKFFLFMKHFKDTVNER